jgi:hypothetical protein
MRGTSGIGKKNPSELASGSILVGTGSCLLNKTDGSARLFLGETALYLLSCGRQNGEGKVDSAETAVRPNGNRMNLSKKIVTASHFALGNSESVSRRNTMQRTSKAFILRQLRTC